MASPLSLGTRRIALADGTYRYAGVLCAGRTPLVECGHEHTNRTMSGRAPSALDCIRRQVRASRIPATADRLVEQAATSWQALTRGPCAQSAETIEGAKQTSAVEAAAQVDRLAAIRAATSAHDTRLIARVWS